MACKSFPLRNPGVSIIAAAVILLTILLQTGAGDAAAFEQQICDIEADSALGFENYPAAITRHLNFLRLHPNKALAHYHLGFAHGALSFGLRLRDDRARLARARRIPQGRPTGPSRMGPIPGFGARLSRTSRPLECDR